jgi:hypothetical protein
VNQSDSSALDRNNSRPHPTAQTPTVPEPSNPIPAPIPRVSGEGFLYLDKPVQYEFLTRIPILRRVGHHIRIPVPQKWMEYLYRSSRVVVSVISGLGLIGALGVAFTASISLLHLFLLLLFLFLSTAVLLAVVFASVFESEDESDNLFHWICHYLRDHKHEVREAFNESKVLGVTKIHDVFGQSTVDNIATYFQHRLRDATAGCCIRILVLDQRPDGSKVWTYKTLARSKKLNNAQRKANSVTLLANEGIAQLFHEHGCFGVCFINDIDKAGKVDKVWKDTPNDRFTDIRYLMVAPINGFEPGSTERKIFGFLYVTSSTRPIPQTYVHIAKALVDTLGSVLPEVLLPLSESINSVEKE